MSINIYLGAFANTGVVVTPVVGVVLDVDAVVPEVGVNSVVQAPRRSIITTRTAENPSNHLDLKLCNMSSPFIDF
jgi:hypothetical protein